MSMFFIFATFFSTLISFSAALSEYANSRWYKRSLHKKWPFNLFAMLTLCTLLICSINNFWERKWCNKDVTLCSPTARTIFKRSNQVRFLTITEPRQLRSNYFGTVCTRKVWQFFLNCMISSSLPVSLSFKVARGFSVANSNMPEDYVWGSILQIKKEASKLWVYRNMLSEN